MQFFPNYLITMTSHIGIYSIYTYICLKINTHTHTHTHTHTYQTVVTHRVAGLNLLDKWHVRTMSGLMQFFHT
jgi:hypothetical protein